MREWRIDWISTISIVVPLLFVSFIAGVVLSETTQKESLTVFDEWEAFKAEQGFAYNNNASNGALFNCQEFAFAFDRFMQDKNLSYKVTAGWLVNPENKSDRTAHALVKVYYDPQSGSMFMPEAFGGRVFVEAESVGINVDNRITVKK